MNLFPAVDPIPLPAPVWLFKVLHLTTLALHFISVEMLLGGLAAALVLNLAGRGKDSQSVIRLNASASIARRLPVVMTYVINLGVPPLLFTQVLYGRALYTSSVLIGAFWISVVFLLIGCYWHLYRFTAKIQEGRRSWPMALVALGLALVISRIYSTNMSLMLHPGVWLEMYSKSGLGIHLPPYDSALTPRWVFMLTGGLAAGGLWMLWLAGRKNIDLDVRAYFSKIGGRLAALMLIVHAAAGVFALNAQPDYVRAALTQNINYHAALWVWGGGVAALFALALWCGFSKNISIVPGWGALAASLVTMLAMVQCRDGVRDLTLQHAGFDVWNRTVAANWPVILLFVGLFVAGLGVVGWLASVVLRAKPVTEKVVS